MKKHRSYLSEKGIFLKKRQERASNEVLDIVNYYWEQMVRQYLGKPGPVSEMLDKVSAREIDPYTASSMIIKQIIENAGFQKN